MSKTILIVDDSPIGRKMIQRCLPEGDFEIKQASNGRECIRIYEEDRPDLVLLDLTMPEMDGFEALRRIKEMDPGCKVIVISADIQSETQKRIMELGALGFLGKPTSPEKLKELIDGHLL